MKDLLVQIALYNRAANGKMLALVGDLPDGLATKDLGLFYGSLQALVGHIALAEHAWLKRFSLFTRTAALSGHAFFAKERAELELELSGDFGKTAELLRGLDSLCVDFLEEVGEEVLGSKIRYAGKSGDTIERLLWQPAFHVLNHATHHRGEISAALDMNGVKNDYAGFMLYL